MSITTQRRAIEKTYGDTCNIYEYKDNVENNITVLSRVMAYENIKCALSQKTLKPTEQSKIENSVTQDGKIFIAPEIIVTPGSLIEINRMGRKIIYECSGEPFIYETHQEIVVKLSSKA